MYEIPNYDRWLDAPYQREMDRQEIEDESVEEDLEEEDYESD
jgi:hypothetical protein